MNFTPTVYATANAGTVTGCWGCTNSIKVSVFAETHVIIDVMGYYEEATGFAGGAVTSLAGTEVTGITQGNSAVTLGGACPAGTVIIGGSMDSTSLLGDVVAAEQYVTGGTTWRQVVRNVSTTPATYAATATSRCMDVK
jgi:hypothetical protein